MNEFIVIAYEKDNGEVPVEDFLNSLDVKMRAKMFGMIGLLQEKDTPVADGVLGDIDEGAGEGNDPDAGIL